MPTKDAPNRPVKTTETVFGIIEAIQESDGASASEIAERVSLAESTIHDHLKTLEYHKYLTEEDGVYRLGLKFLNLGEHALSQHSITQFVEPHLHEIAEETSETAWLFVLEHDASVALLKEQGAHGTARDNWIGKYIPLHCTAGGKAMLAHLSENRREEYFETGDLNAVTESTITDPETLRTELEEIRKKGYAISDGETVSKMRAVASPIVVDSEVLGEITVSGPRFRLRGEKIESAIPDLLLAVTNEIEINISNATITNTVA